MTLSEEFTRYYEIFYNDEFDDRHFETRQEAIDATKELIKTEELDDDVIENIQIYYYYNSDGRFDIEYWDSIMAEEEPKPKKRRVVIIKKK
jgi:hypothetical protein